MVKIQGIAVVWDQLWKMVSNWVLYKLDDNSSVFFGGHF